MRVWREHTFSDLGMALLGGAILIVLAWGWWRYAALRSRREARPSKPRWRWGLDASGPPIGISGRIGFTGVIGSFGVLMLLEAGGAGASNATAVRTLLIAFVLLLLAACYETVALPLLKRRARDRNAVDREESPPG
jgi:hypothetical protein